MHNLDLNRLKWVMELLAPTFDEIQCRAKQIAEAKENEGYRYDVESAINSITEELAYKISDWVRGEIKDY